MCPKVARLVLRTVFNQIRAAVGDILLLKSNLSEKIPGSNSEEAAFYLTFTAVFQEL